MKKNELLEKVQNRDYKYNRGQLISWVQELPNSYILEVNQYKAGDVFMHPIFKHPYILLERKDDFWICTLLTSNGDFKEVLTQCRSRFFFGESYITKTLFTMTDPIGKFMGVYDNPRHLKDVTKKLKIIFG